MQIQGLFDPDTWALTYVVWDEATGDAVVIDPVLDFDPLRVSFDTASNDRVVDLVTDQRLRVHWILETHAHDDHVSGSRDLGRRLDAGVAIGEHVRTVQRTLRDLLHLPALATDGAPFDRLLRDGETLQAGSLSVGVIHTPGHTPACVSYTIGDAVFTGGALLAPDQGTGRCDLPGGSAADLWASVARKLHALPDVTRVFVGHDDPRDDREVRFETTIGASKAHNVELPAGRGREDFVSLRTARDRTLAPPRLLFPSLQLNVEAGRLPPPEANGRRYLKLPIGLFD